MEELAETAANDCELLKFLAGVYAEEETYR